MKFNPLSNIGEQVSHCTIQDPVTGETCCKESDPDAPWAICEHHGRLIAMRYSSGLILSALRGRTPEFEQELQQREEIAAEVRRDHGVVYYVDYGDSIKIGTSAQLAIRLTDLRRKREHVLATEPGSFEVEGQRHEQFKHLRIGTSEDFRPDVELLLHIKSVRDEHGDPQFAGVVGPYSTEVTRRMADRAIH